MNLDIDSFLEGARRFADLGFPVQDQIERVLEGDAAECNPSALREIRGFFTFLSAQIGIIGVDEYIDDITRILGDA